MACSRDAVMLEENTRGELENALEELREFFDALLDFMELVNDFEDALVFEIDNYS